MSWLSVQNYDKNYVHDIYFIILTIYLRFITGYLIENHDE